MIGRRIGRFVVERQLGAGGMGAVYAARDEVLGRLVALKVLPAAFEDDPEKRGRLLREARSAAALSHANVATVYEAGEGEGVVFLAMELVDGESLAQRVARGPLALEDLAKIGSGIARGLACAHEAGVVHRDLKPANVMLARDGTPKLVDFGLARPPEAPDPGSSRDSFTGIVVGTPGYMAPEQLRGEPTDARTDLFALGVVLFELWTGRPPFGDAGLSAMALTLHEDPPPLSEARAGAPEDLARLVRELLEKSAARRPGEARDVVRRLDALRTGPITVETDASAPAAARAAEIAALPAGTAPTIAVVRASRRPIDSEATLLGREEDLARIEAALAEGARLVSVTGPPGIGKTAVAQLLATRVAARGGRATSVQLGPVATLEEIESALAVALRRGSAPARLVELLALEDGLVFLDGGEAVTSALAERMDEWLGSCPRVRFVASRRSELGIAAETVVRLGPLPRDAARELFGARARRLRLGSPSETREDREAVDAIVDALDANPLALCLAASRASILSPQQIADRLRGGDEEARLALLSDRRGGKSGGSLREAIAWSFALLTPDDARALARLSLFEGPFTIDTAEQVAHLPGEPGDAIELLDVIERARAASLLRGSVDGRGRVRTVLEPNVRAFARARLEDDPRADEVKEAFVHALGALARDAVLAPEHAGHVAAEEGASMRAAVRLASGSPGAMIPAMWCAALLVAQAGEPEIEEALARMLAARAEAGMPPELRVHAELALNAQRGERDVEAAADASTTIRARAEETGDASLLATARSAEFDALARAARYPAARAVAEAMLRDARARSSAPAEIDAQEKRALIAWRASEPESALEALARALTLAEALRDRRRQANVLLSLGILCVQTQRFVEARSFYERSRELARAEHLTRVVGVIANNLGVVHHEQDRLDAARETFEEAIAQGTRAGAALLAGVAHGNAGMVDHEAGRLASARVHLDTSVQILAALGDTRFRAALLAARAALHADMGELDLARADLDAAGALLARAFEPQLALALSIRSTHVDLAEALARRDADAIARTRDAARAYLDEARDAASVAARSDLARMALRALGRRLAREG